MRVKILAQKNKMGKSNTTNAPTSWVPSDFKQKDLSKAQADGLISDDDQVIFPSTKRIPKLPSGFRVMFLAFSCAVSLSLPTSSFVGFSLCTVCSFTSSHQTQFFTLLVSLPFVSLFWGSNPIFFSRNFSFGSAPVSLYQKSLSWAGLLFLSVLNLSTWSFSWLPQYKVGGRSGFISKTGKSLPLTSTTLPLLMPLKN
jgi:hypothetical protein